MTGKTIYDLFNLSDKIIVITGGLGQLGRQFSMALVNSGAKVAIFDKTNDIQSLKKKYFDAALSDDIFCTEVDVTDASSVKEGLKSVCLKWGTPHGLINNAALDSPPNAPPEENGPFESYPETSWDKVMDVNLKGIFLCCQIIGGAMAEQRRGAIINICSTYGLVSPDQRLYEYKRIKSDNPFYKPIAYSASKGALPNMSRYLSTYWAESGVRVNTLTFGGVFNHQDEVFVKGYCSHVPLGRMANADEYNGAIIFLLSNASSYMTGANLVIDGGWTAW